MSDINRRTLVRSAAVGAAVAGFLSTAAQAADGKFYVIAELVSKPDKADALRELLIPFTAGSRKEPGCLHYVLLEDGHQPGRFLTFETWTDEAALNAHMTTPEIKAAAPKLAEILAKPFTQIKLGIVSE